MKNVFRITVIGILVCMSINRAVAHITTHNPVRPSARVFWSNPFGSGPGNINVVTTVSFNIGFHDPNEGGSDHIHPGEYFMNHVIEDADGDPVVFAYYYDSFELDIHDPDDTFHTDPPSTHSISGCMKGFGQSQGWVSTRSTWTAAVRCRKMKEQGASCGTCTETSTDSWSAQEVFDELKNVVAAAKQLNPDVTGAVNRNGQIFLAHNNALNEAVDFPVHVLSEVTNVLAVPAAPAVRKPNGTLTTSWGALKKG